MRRKKANTGAAVLIIIFGVFILGTVIFYAYNIHKNSKEYFVPIRKNIAEKYYNEVIQYDFESSYPESAEEVMELTNKVSLLLYGDMLLDEELIEGILVQQRYMYSNQLLSTTTFEEQYNNLLTGLNKYKELGTVIHSIEKESTKYDHYDEASAVIRVVQHTNMGDLVWEYYLVKEEGTDNFKINKFILVNEG